MTLETLQKEIQDWPQSELQRLQGYLVALRHRRSGAAEKMAAKQNDASSDRWLTLEEVDRRLGLQDSAE